MVAQSGTAEPVVSVMEEGNPFANARVHPSPAPAPVPIGQQPPAKAIPTMEPVVVSTPAEQPENAPVPAAVNTPRAGDGACCRTCCAGAADQKGGGPGRSCGEQLRLRRNRRKIWRGARRNYRYPPVSLLHENGGENHMAAGAELRNNSRRLRRPWPASAWTPRQAT